MDLLQSSEKAHLFLDVMSCPFVSIETRRFLYRKYLKSYEPKLNRSHLEIENDLQSLLQTYWFVKWDELDIVKMIEKKNWKKAINLINMSRGQFQNTYVIVVGVFYIDYEDDFAGTEIGLNA